MISCNSAYHLRYAPQSVSQQRCKATMSPIHFLPERSEGKTKVIRQQCLSFTVCAAECEAAEEQGDDEAHTLQVPERSEGKTKVIRQ